VNKPRKILPKESNVPNGETSSNATRPSPAANLTVDSLIKLAMSQDIPENLESLILSKPLNLDKTPSGHVHTEEIDSGIALGHSLKTVKEVENLTEAMNHLDSTKHDADDLLDNLKSSEDEDPFKFLSPSHIPSFPPEGWLNEEVCDMGNIYTLLIIKYQPRVARTVQSSSG
jgi:hypothetical protein